VRHVLSVAVLHFFLPALAFGLVAGSSVDRTFLAVPATAALTTLAGLGAGLLLHRLAPGLRGLPRPAAGVLVLATTFGNVMYLGLPVITETVGERFGYVAILYDLLATTPILLTAGMLAAARFGGGEASLRASLRRVLRLPPLWGVAAGIAVQLAGLPTPAVVLDAARLMGRAVIPVMIFTVGLALDFRDLRRVPVALPALAVKLLAVPLLAWGLGRLAGLGGDVLRSVTIEGAMPVMVLTLVIADEFRLDVPLAATCIAVSTVASFFTVPAILAALPF